MWILQDQGHTTFPLANLPCLNSSMVRTKVTQRKGEKGVTPSAKDQSSSPQGRREEEALITPHLQLSRLLLRLERLWEESHRQSSWRGWGGHHHHHQPNSWPRWLQRLGHLSLHGEEPACKKLCPTVGGKAPLEGVLTGQPGKETKKVPAWDSCPLWDLGVPKEQRAPYLETPLLTASLQDSPRSGQIWYALSYACRKLQRHI